MATKYVCSECGGTNVSVEYSYWCNPNTEDRKEIGEGAVMMSDDTGNCDDCEGECFIEAVEVEEGDTMEVAA